MVDHRPGNGDCWLASLAGLICLAGFLAACDPVSLTSDRVSRAPDPFDAIRNLDLQPRFPQPSGTSGPPPQGPRLPVPPSLETPGEQRHHNPDKTWSTPLSAKLSHFPIDEARGDPFVAGVVQEARSSAA